MFQTIYLLVKYGTSSSSPLPRSPAISPYEASVALEEWTVLVISILNGTKRTRKGACCKFPIYWFVVLKVLSVWYMRYVVSALRVTATRPISSFIPFTPLLSVPRRSTRITTMLQFLQPMKSKASESTEIAASTTGEWNSGEKSILTCFFNCFFVDPTFN